MLSGKCYKYFLFLTLAALLLLGGNAFGDAKATYFDGVYFDANYGDNTIHIEGVTGNPESETIVFPVKMKLDNTVGVGQNVGNIHVYITYDNTKFSFEDATMADGLGFDFLCTTCGLDNGVIQLSFSAGTEPTSDFYGDYVTIANITVKAKCQPVGVWHKFEFPDYDPSNPLRNAIITSANDEYIADESTELKDKSVYVNMLSFAVASTYDSYAGALGTVIEVPVKLYNTAYIDELGFQFTYDSDKLYYLGITDYDDFFPEGPTGTPPSPGDNPVALHFQSPVGPSVPPNGSGVEIMKIRFYCKYDVSFWDGETTVISFPTNDIVIGVHQLTIGSCPDAINGSAVYGGGGSVTIPAYNTEFNSETSGLVFQNDAGTVTFGVNVGMKNNFPVGKIGSTSDNNPTDSKVRVDFSFTADMNAGIDNIYHPTSPDPENPLDDFYFGVHMGDAKGTAWNVEFYSKFTDGLDNFRDTTTEFQPLLQFDLDMDGGWDEPVSYDDHGFSIPFACNYEGSPARVLDTTGQRSVECGTGYNPGSLDFEYAVGRVYCPPVLATEPSNVTQPYYLYGNFDIDDFEVVVIKSGVHNVVSYTAEDGVDVSFNGTDQVTFTKNANWVPTDGSDGILIGTVTYSRYYIPAEIADPDPFGTQKSIGPGTTWCYKTTTISYGASTFIEGENGRLPWMYNVANTVKTRYNCGIIHTDPGDDSVEPFKQGIPTEFKLTANYPNPFNPTTTIAFELPQSSPIKIEVFNLLGQKVATLVDGYREAGRFEVVWNGTDEAGKQVSSGIYFCRMIAGEYTGTLKMMMMK